MRTIIVLIITCLFFVNDAPAQNAIATIKRYEVKENFRQRFRRALRQYERKAHCHKSNIMAEAFYEQDHRYVFWTIERWTGEDRLHHFGRIKRLSRRALVSQVQEYSVTDLEPLSKSEWKRKPSADDRAITIMLFVDCKPGTEDTFKSTYHTAMPKFRSEPGVVNYQLSQFNNDETKFVTYEKFRSDDAFQFHLSFPPIQPVVDFLNTSIKEQPFQKGLHRLISFK